MTRAGGPERSDASPKARDRMKSTIYDGDGPFVFVECHGGSQHRRHRVQACRFCLHQGSNCVCREEYCRYGRPCLPPAHLSRFIEVSCFSWRKVGVSLGEEDIPSNLYSGLIVRVLLSKATHYSHDKRAPFFLLRKRGQQRKGRGRPDQGVHLVIARNGTCEAQAGCGKQRRSRRRRASSALNSLEVP